MVRKKVVVQVKLAIHNRPSRRIYVGNPIDRHCVSAVAAVLGKVLYRVSLEAPEVLGRSEPIVHALPIIGITPNSRYRHTETEIGDGVIALDPDIVCGVYSWYSQLLVCSCGTSDACD